MESPSSSPARGALGSVSLLEFDVTLGVNVITVAVGLPGPIGVERMVFPQSHVKHAAARDVAAILSVDEQLPVASVALV
jgi:hypothetical protein